MNDPRPFAYLSWVGALFSWFESAVAAQPTLLSILATGFAALASVAACWVSWRTVRVRRLEETVAQQHVCEECGRGFPPPVCPMGYLPQSCKLKGPQK